MNIRLNRLWYVLMIAIVVCLGLLSRRMANQLPDVINLFLGDSFWALMIYLVLRMVFRNWSVKKVAVFGLAFCFIIELSQLYHDKWIDMIRSTTLGGLVLGYGFLWSDLVAYSIGIGSGIIVDYCIDIRNNLLFNRRRI